MRDMILSGIGILAIAFSMPEIMSTVEDKPSLLIPIIGGLLIIISLGLTKEYKK
jgi:hypothetical protein